VTPKSLYAGTRSTSLTGYVLPWTNKIRYLITLIESRVFKCAIDDAKCSFYRAANAIFGKVGRIASEEVTLQLIKSKCMLILLYGLVTCPLNKSQLSSIDFVINRLFVKLFNTSDMEIVACCQDYSSFELPSVTLARRTNKFLDRLKLNENSVLQL